jgi:hypothetical protein
MARITIFSFFLFIYIKGEAQLISSPDTIIIGSAKYLPAVLEISNRYSPILDSLTNIRVNSKTVNSAKQNIPDKTEGYYIDQELNDYERLINQFLPFSNVKAVYHYITGKKKESYYEVSFVRSIPSVKGGVVRWYEE